MGPFAPTYYTDPPVARGSKKPAVRKIRTKVDFDQEKGEVTNKACMECMGGDGV